GGRAPADRAADQRQGAGGGDTAASPAAGVAVGDRDPDDCQGAPGHDLEDPVEPATVDGDRAAGSIRASDGDVGTADNVEVALGGSILAASVSRNRAANTQR